MDKQQLYLITLKMLNDKYNINEYPLQKFNNIYTYIYNNYKTTIPDNNINKQILIYIKSDIENTINNKNTNMNTNMNTNTNTNMNTNMNTNTNTNMNTNMNTNTNTNMNTNDDYFNIELKLKEIELIRSTLKEETEKKLKETDYEQIGTNGSRNGNGSSSGSGKKGDVMEQKGTIGSGGVINIIKTDTTTTYKTFVVHLNRNELNITTGNDINNKTNNIYPCCICFSKSFLKMKNSPYITLRVKDDIKKQEYSFVHINKTTLKPVIDNYNYMDIGVNNRWSISLLDSNGNVININEYYYEIIDVLEIETENSYSLNINTDFYNNFDINDDVIIISEHKTTNTKIINKNNNRIFINKNNLKLEDFKFATIFNSKFQVSVFFKYHPK